MDEITRKSKEKKEYAERKGTVRIVINSFLNAFCIALLAFFLNGDNSKFLEEVVIFLLVISVPVLFTSSLFYTKVAYRKFEEYRRWNKLAWLTHTLGYFALINAIFLTIHNFGHYSAAYVFISVTMGLTILYSIIDVSLDKSRLWEKIWKEALYVLLVYVGGIVYLDVPRIYTTLIISIFIVVMLVGARISWRIEQEQAKVQEN